MKKTEAPINVLKVIDPAGQTGELKLVGGSNSDTWNILLANQVFGSLWTKHSDEQYKNTQFEGTIAGLMGIAPRDELEGMIAAQLIAAHNAAMECYRRAMIGEQTLEGRRENLSQANKLSRTYAMLLDALNRHRGKGQQKVTVEHVHVHEGGQAIVGHVEGGWAADQIGGSTSCTWTCTGRDVAERKHGAGNRASRPRWQTVSAECTVDRLRAHRREIDTHTSMAVSRQKRSPGDAKYRP